MQSDWRARPGGPQAVQAAQITFEDFFLSSMDISPLKIVGFEGLWGSLAMVVVLLPLVQHLPGAEGGGLHEDSIDTLHVRAPLRDPLDPLFLPSPPSFSPSPTFPHPPCWGTCWCALSVQWGKRGHQFLDIPAPAPANVAMRAL